jgi:imidazoleglycerol-phosphate dehydratase
MTAEGTGAARTATVRRTTRETDITVELSLDGTGEAEVSTGIGAYDHLLASFAYHGMLDVRIAATGDLHVDEHHTVEDVALALGQAISDALGDRRGIRRFGEASVPMDESLATTVLDLSGRPYAVLDLPFLGERIGALPTQLVPHALESFARTAGMTLHMRASGRNDHHIAEAAFKSLSRAVRAAVAVDPRRTGAPSTKGTLTDPRAG